MLICVDGTGPSSDEEYEQRTKSSFVRTIHNTSALPNKRYYRGPDWSGVGAKLVQPISLVSVMKNFWNLGDHQVFMAGFSRGAAIVINTAALLKQHKIEVEALFLFDAVDRSVKLNANVIPSNVRNAYHALRMKSAGSRETFGNCGLRLEGSGDYQKQGFKATHGAIGGTPWGERGLARTLRFVGMKDMPWENPKSAKTYGKNPTLAEQDKAERERYMQTGRIDEGGIDAGTTITIEQEKVAMELVRVWMWPFLEKHCVL